MDVLKYADINPDDAKHMAQRLHRKKDDLNFVRKVFTIDKVEAVDEERSIVARVSTNDRDRDGEVVEPKGIDLSNYTKNPCLLWAHRYDMPAIGKALWSKTDDKGLICKFQFAPTQFADEIYQLYKGGYQRAFSIGFIPMDFDSVEKIHRKVSLLEVSAVPVPANQDALVLEAYQKGMIKSDQLMQDLNVVMTPVSGSVPGMHTIVCEPGTDNKILDAENNPAISDLFTAISNALNPPAQPVEPGTPQKPWYAVQDVFPVDFPNGHCIFAEYLPGRDIHPTYRQDYTFADGRATMEGERTEVVVAYREKSAEVITKPETTDSYHRIPVSEGHGDHEIRTITVSAKDGIKALYCMDCKEIATYLFDVDKFTMAEAEAWIEEHKKDAAVPESKQAPAPAPSDLSAELASLRQDVAAILARLQVTPEPAPAPAPAPVDDIAFEPEPDIVIDASPEIVIEPSAPDKTAEVLIDEYLRSADYKKAVAEAIEVALAKVRGRVI